MAPSDTREVGSHKLDDSGLLPLRKYAYRPYLQGGSLTMDPEGKRIFALDDDRGELVVVDATSLKTVRRTKLCQRPEQVVVAPHVGSQISMISALANPVAGAMVFIAQKVFEKQLAKMIQYQYDITGSWDEPEFTTARWEPELLEETSR